MPQESLQRPEVDVASQLHGRVSRPKFVQEPAFAVRSSAAMPFICLAGPAIEPGRLGDTLERPQEVPIRLSPRRREEELRAGANHLAILSETFHQLVGGRDLALLPVFRREMPLRFRFDSDALPGAYISPTGVAHLGVTHSRHEEKFKENAIAEIAGDKKPVQFFWLVYLRLSFDVAWPIAFLKQSRNVVRLEELGHDRQFVVCRPGIVFFLANEKRGETLQVAAIDVPEVALRARLLKMFQSHPVRLIRFHLLAR